MVGSQRATAAKSVLNLIIPKISQKERLTSFTNEAVFTWICYKRQAEKVVVRKHSFSLCFHPGVGPFCRGLYCSRCELWNRACVSCCCLLSSCPSATAEAQAALLPRCFLLTCTTLHLIYVSKSVHFDSLLRLKLIFSNFLQVRRWLIFFSRL